MPISDLVYNADLATYYPGCNCGNTTTTTSTTNTSGKDCCGDRVYVMMPPPPTKFPLYPYPAYPQPCDCNNESTSIKQSEVEKQICKLSKKAATLRTLIENISEKNKSVIIKSGAVSYNLGEYKSKDPDDADLDIEDENIESIIEILKVKLEEIKAKIKELSDEIVTGD